MNILSFTVSFSFHWTFLASQEGFPEFAFSPKEIHQKGMPTMGLFYILLPVKIDFLLEELDEFLLPLEKFRGKNCLLNSLLINLVNCEQSFVLS